MKSSTLVSEIRVIIYPKDFRRSRRFYSEIIQWRIEHEWDEKDSKGVMFATGAGTIELLWPDDSRSFLGNCNLSLRVADIASLWKELEGKATLVFGLRHNAWGDHSFCVCDPDGNNLTFFAATSAS
jgi:catechol 2,3-dioxygenase-like lactoylglutathione lyase family enzyme